MKNKITDKVKLILMLVCSIFLLASGSPISGTPDDISWSGGHQKLDRAQSLTVLDTDITGGHTEGVLTCGLRAPHSPQCSEV